MHANPFRSRSTARLCRWLVPAALLLLSTEAAAGCRLAPDSAGSAAVQAANAAERPVQFWEATDLHYLDPSLTDGQEAFQAYVASGDGKQLGLIDQILNAFVYQADRQKPKFIILSGDLTNNGERASHEGLARKLALIEEQGTSVYVIPGNHDLLNPWARAFKGSRQVVTDSITPKEFLKLYEAFGYGEAVSRDSQSLSYVVRAAPGLWLLMLDSCQYENNTKLNFPQTDGRLLPSTLAWIQSALSGAAEEHAAVITVMHHNLMDHSDLPLSGFTLNNSGQVLDMFRSSGLNLALSGHIHMQDIRVDPSEGAADHPAAPVYDVATSALSVYPHQFGSMTYDPRTGRAAYQSTPVDVDAWAAASGATDPNLLSFRAYAEKKFKDDSYNKAYSGLKDSSFSDSQKREMAEAMAELNARYFAGTAGSETEELHGLPGIRLWTEVKDGFLPSYVQSMLKPKALSNTSLEVYLNRR